ncbi:tail tip assembly protein K [Proteus phage 309]|uniref:Tail tip assembly protein K n=1 Tax=Proteus phage 309 TaxID=2894355 RepID=A0AAE8YHL1_9CAUD|nr:tail tip assembly protein K [Proteus phage 309]
MSNTQSNSSNNTKTVLYYGKEIQVPNDAKWIHTDSDGMVYTASGPATTGDNFYLTSEAHTVHSFNHTEMSTINWMLSQKRIQDLPSVSSRIEQKAHPHADLMLKYAMIAQYDDKPWENFECRSEKGTWYAMVADSTFYSNLEYRLKPQPIRIKEGQLWRSTKEAVLVEVHPVKHPELQKGSIVVAQRLNPELTLYSELTKTELQEHFTLVK